MRRAARWLFTARGAVGVLAASVILASALFLMRADDGVTITSHRINGAPATVFAPADGSPPRATVVVAHGFSGSQQLMRPIALALAQNGYRAVTFDFLGHGRHPAPLTGDVTREDGATRALMAQIAQVVAFARGEASGPVALLGHSMAADIIVRSAQEDPSIAATVAVSIFSPAPTAETPRNFLIVTGAYEEALRAEALRIVGLAVADPMEGATYTEAGFGARRAAVAGGVEHIGVLYSVDTFRESLDWLGAQIDAAPTGDMRASWPLAWYGPLLLTLVAAIVALGWPLARQLPRDPASAAVDRPVMGPGAFALVAIAPAIITPITLWLLQVQLLPVLVGDYLAQHFALYGVLTAIGVWLWRRRLRKRGQDTGPVLGLFIPAHPSVGAIGAAMVAVYGIVALGAPIDAFGTSFVLTVERAPLFAVMLIGALAYFIADERLTREARRGRYAAYAITKLCFLASLAFAIALDLERLFFLIIITPVILAAFVVFGLFGAWAYHRTGDSWVGGAGVGAAVAWAVAATFPIVGS